MVKKNLGLDIRLVDIDLDNGFKCDKLDELGIDVMFVMPENQLPTGHCMSKKSSAENLPSGAAEKTAANT